MESGTGAERCPACGAPRGTAREYCLECGARLDRTASPPVHWLWPALGALVLAAAGGAVAATASHGGGSSARTLVATQRLVSVPAVTSTGKTVRPARTAKPTRSTRTLIPWPGTGYTIVLVSIPTSRGAGVAKRRALDALEAGLPQVGVLVSSSYAGLHPGYFIVFSGVYGTLDEAQSALPDARPAFPGAYARLVTR